MKNNLKVYQTKHNGLFFKVLAESQESASAQDKKIIFLSYKKIDNEQNLLRTGINVRDKIVEMILKAGDCAVWVDDGIIGGTDWDESNIRKALGICSMMVLLVTPSIFDPEGYIARVEVKTVLSRRDINKDSLPIYPVIVDPVLAMHAQDTWEKVSLLTNSKEQGDILLEYQGKTDAESRFALAIKNALGKIPDSGIISRITKIAEFLNNNDYQNAARANQELRQITPNRYESYWFECCIITDNFKNLRSFCDNEYRLYTLAKKYASRENALAMERIFDQYVLNIINYNETTNPQWNKKVALTILGYLSKNAVLVNKDSLSHLSNKYIGAYIDSAYRSCFEKISKFEPKYDYEGNQTRSVYDIVNDSHGGDNNHYDFARAKAYYEWFSMLHYEAINIQQSAACELINVQLKERLANIIFNFRIRMDLLSRYMNDFAEIISRRELLKNSEEIRTYKSRLVALRIIVCIVAIFMIIVGLNLINAIGDSAVIMIIDAVVVIIGVGISFLTTRFEDTKVKKLLLKHYPYLIQLKTTIPQINKNSVNY